MILLISDTKLASLEESDGLLYGDFADGLCYAAVKEARWNIEPTTKTLITVIDPLTHPHLTKERDYAIDITTGVTVMPATKKPFKEVPVGGHFLSRAGAMCRRLEEGIGGAHCQCHYPDGDSYIHFFEDDHDVYWVDPEKVEIHET